MPEAKQTATAEIDEEPRLARAFAGALRQLSAPRAAAILTRAAYLTLNRPGGPAEADAHQTQPGQILYGFLGTPEEALDRGTIVEAEADPRLDALKRLVDQVEVKRFDHRMEASMTKSVEAVLNGTQWLTAAELGRAARPTAANPHSVTSRWRAAKRIFGVEWRGQLLFARYAFDEHFEPLPAMVKVLKTLETSSPLEIASWFESPNSYLDGARPREVLASTPELVVQAAEDSLSGPTHG